MSQLFGLSEDQYLNQDLVYFWRAEPAMVHGLVSAGETRPPTNAPISNAEAVNKMIDASASGWVVDADHLIGANDPCLWDNSTFTHSIAADGNNECMVFRKSREAMRFLTDGSTDYTLLAIVSKASAISTAPDKFIGSYTGANRGIVWGSTSISGELGFGVRSSVAFSGPTHVPSTHSNDTLYRHAVRITGTTCEMFMADLGATIGAAKASATITTFQAGLAASDLTVMGRHDQVAASDFWDGNMIGLAIAKRALSEAEMNALFDVMEAPQ